MPAMTFSSLEHDQGGRGLRAWLGRWLGRRSGGLDPGRPSGSPEPGFPTHGSASSDEPGPSARGAPSRQLLPDLVPDADNPLHTLGASDPRSRMMALLARGEGASVAEITEVTGWQAHSVRAALSGLRKRGVVIERIGRDGRACRHRALPDGGRNAADNFPLASAGPSGAAASSSDVPRPPDGALTASLSLNRPEGAA